ncbi:replication factor C 38kD subunit [Culex quinquefasciatus]|uniref:Replication factor C 38kD subunit n=1 Tax=Culex quinquefasciatus TaxID=7176 RepID=B0VZ24_CULQU|nr:replication factor C 38kD subunit [Culex quinquefasciatus]|eukprot:XP_001841796.1 replication factor C 38kD subunit [Culex quinquefasciatus]
MKFTTPWSNHHIEVNPDGGFYDRIVITEQIAQTQQIDPSGQREIKTIVLSEVKKLTKDAQSQRKKKLLRKCAGTFCCWRRARCCSIRSPCNKTCWRSTDRCSWARPLEASWELLSQGFPSDVTFHGLVENLFKNCDMRLKKQTLYFISLYEHLMQQGSKHIIHRETSVAQVMTQEVFEPCVRNGHG